MQVNRIRLRETIHFRRTCPIKQQAALACDDACVRLNTEDLVMKSFKKGGRMPEQSLKPFLNRKIKYRFARSSLVVIPLLSTQGTNFAPFFLVPSVLVAVEVDTAIVSYNTNAGLQNCYF